MKKLWDKKGAKGTDSKVNQEVEDYTVGVDYLLDLELLRRDEIWFAEKDNSGATRLYSMTDFKIRNDLEIRKHYLQGRFGAIPYLGNLDRLKSEKCAEE